MQAAARWAAWACDIRHSGAIGCNGVACGRPGRGTGDEGTQADLGQRLAQAGKRTVSGAGWAQRRLLAGRRRGQVSAVEAEDSSRSHLVAVPSRAARLPSPS